MKPDDFTVNKVQTLTLKSDPKKTGVVYEYARTNENGEEEIIKDQGMILPKDPCERNEKHMAEKKRRRAKKSKIKEPQELDQVD